MMNFLKTSTLVLVFIINLTAVPMSVFAKNSDGWINHFNMKRAIKRNKAAGRIPVSIQCRNRPGTKVATKPEFKISWVPNTSNRPWALEAETAHAGLTFGPVQSLVDHRFRLVSKDSFSIKYQQKIIKYRCAIWHR